MAKRYFLRFLLHGEDDLLFEVRKNDSDRLRDVLSNATKLESLQEFFWFGAVDGVSVILNLSALQAVRFLWEPAEGPSDLKRETSGVRIRLRGRQEVLLVEHVEHLDGLYDIFTNLEFGPAVVPFPSFIDEDGELLHLNAREVVWVIAPTHLLDEGAKIIAKEDGLIDDEDR